MSPREGSSPNRGYQCSNSCVSYDERGLPVPTPVPSTQGAAILVESQRRLFVSTFAPLVLVPLFGFPLISGSAPVLEGLAVLAGVTCLLGLRPLIWSFGIGVRSLVVTPAHLVEMTRGKPRRWVSWSDVREFTLTCSTHAGATRTRHYLLIAVSPDLAVQPTATFVPQFGEIAQNYRNAPGAAMRIAEEAQRRGIATTIYKDPWGYGQHLWTHISTR